jgi:hypothetical protein
MAAEAGNISSGILTHIAFYAPQQSVSYFTKLNTTYWAHQSVYFSRKEKITLITHGTFMPPFTIY